MNGRIKKMNGDLEILTLKYVYHMWAAKGIHQY